VADAVERPATRLEAYVTGRLDAELSRLNPLKNGLLREKCRFVFDRSLEAREGRRFSPRATVPSESDLVPSESVQPNYGPIGVVLGKLIGKVRTRSPAAPVMIVGAAGRLGFER
jgi:hypothetical protein